MVNLGTLIALIFFPALIVLMSLVLGEIKHEKSIVNNFGFDAIDASIRTIPGITGLFMLLFFAFYSFEYGIAVSWSALGYLLGIILSFVLVLRYKLSIQNHPILSAFFSPANKELPKTAKLIISIIILIAILLISAQIHLLSKSISPFTSILSYWQTTAIIVGFMLLFSLARPPHQRVILYTSFVLSLLIITVIPILMLFKTGGLNTLFTNLQRTDITLLDINNQAAWFTLGGLFIGLGVFSQPHFIHAMLFIKDSRDLSKFGITTVCLSTILVWTSIYAGLIAKSIAPSALPSDFGQTIHQHFLAPYFIISNKFDSNFTLILLLIGIASLGLSCIFVISSFIRKITLNLTPSNRQPAINTAVKIFIPMITLVVLTLFSDKGISEPHLIWTLAGCSLAPVFASAFWRKINLFSILFSVVISFVFTLIWHYLRVNGFRFLDKSLWHEIIPGFLFAFTALVLIEFILDRKNS